MTDATITLDDLGARYDDALTRLLQERKRFKGLGTVGFAELAALKDAALPHLQRIVDLGLTVTGVDVERGLPVVRLQHAAIAQDVETGGMTMHGYVRVWKKPVLGTLRGSARIVPLRTPDDIADAYGRLSEVDRTLLIAYGVDKEGAADPLAVYDALAGDLEEAEDLTTGAWDAGNRTQGRLLIQGLLDRGVAVERIRQGDTVNTLVVETPDAVVVQNRDGSLRTRIRIDGKTGGWAGPVVTDANGAIAQYFDEVLPAVKVERALQTRAREEREQAERRRNTRESGIVAAYEALPIEMRDGFKAMLAYISLGEERMSRGDWRRPRRDRHHDDMPFGHPFDGPFGHPFAFHPKHMPPIATMLLRELDMIERADAADRTEGDR
jgi:hypothetical protein